MFKFLRDLSIKWKMALFIVIPTALCLLLSSDRMLENRKTYLEIEEIKSIADAVPKLSMLVHELQKERGYSAGYLGSRRA